MPMVRLLTCVAFSTGATYYEGDQVDLPEKRAQELIVAGIAERVEHEQHTAASAATKKRAKANEKLH